MRDVTRLANSILLNFYSLKGEVDFADILKLELLRKTYPSAYELIYRKVDIFFEAKPNSIEQTYRLIEYETNEKDQFQNKIKKTIFEDY